MSLVPMLVDLLNSICTLHCNSHDQCNHEVSNTSIIVTNSVSDHAASMHFVVLEGCIS